MGDDPSKWLDWDSAIQLFHKSRQLPGFKKLFCNLENCRIYKLRIHRMAERAYITESLKSRFRKPGYTSSNPIGYPQLRYLHFKIL
jgi:hypothetical protein